MKYSGEVRPWGSFINLADNVKCTVKVMTLLPEQRLSVQYHRKRDQLYYALEIGLIVSHTPGIFLSLKKKYELKDLLEIWSTTSIDTKVYDIGAMFYFPAGCLHTCLNSTDESIIFLDVAFGENDEEDIVRIIDRYGR